MADDTSSTITVTVDTTDDLSESLYVALLDVTTRILEAYKVTPDSARELLGDYYMTSTLEEIGEYYENNVEY